MKDRAEEDIYIPGYGGKESCPLRLSQNATFSFWSAELNVTQLKKDDGDMSLRRHSSILCF
jgi:hypothetical protein